MAASHLQRGSFAMKRYLLLLILASAVTTGCVRRFTLTDFTTGVIATGTFTSSRTAKITLPNGELFTGQWSAVKNAAFTFGLTGEVETSPTFVGVGDQIYALLKSNKGVLMEAIANYGSGTGGVGQARTNDGRTYRLQF